MSTNPLLVALRAAIGDREFVAVSEWLGYLPYGRYIWIEVDGADVALSEPFDSSDLDRLETSGLIVRLDRQTAADQTRTTYRFR